MPGDTKITPSIVSPSSSFAESAAATSKEMQKKLLEVKTEENNRLIKEADDYLAWQRNLECSEYAAMLNEKTLITDQKGQKTSEWQRVISDAEAAINSEANTYNDWRAAMICLLTMYSNLSSAINHSLAATIMPSVKYEKFYPLLDKVTRSFEHKPKIDLPSLSQFVEYKKDSGLEVNLSRSDKGEIGALDKIFTHGVVLWLKENGYKPKPKDETKFINENGDELAPDTFQKLKDDPKMGLNSYLEEFKQHGVVMTPMR